MALNKAADRRIHGRSHRRSRLLDLRLTQLAPKEPAPHRQRRRPPDRRAEGTALPWWRRWWSAY
jgi:hypothetical protein